MIGVSAGWISCCVVRAPPYVIGLQNRLILGVDDYGCVEDEDKWKVKWSNKQCEQLDGSSPAPIRMRSLS